MTKNKTGFPIWVKYKNFINNLQPNQKFTRKFMFRRIYGINDGSVLVARENCIDHYRRYSVLCGIITHEGLGLYKKISNIPDNLTLNEFVKVAYDEPWKTWFVPQEERFKDSVS
jgi:hypothetical protein